MKKRNKMNLVCKNAIIARLKEHDNVTMLGLLRRLRRNGYPLPESSKKVNSVLRESLQNLKDCNPLALDRPSYEIRRCLIRFVREDVPVDAIFIEK